MKEIEIAGAVILNEERKILLIHRNTKNRIQWELPGGKVEENETPKMATIRELKEELNINISIIQYLGKDISYEDGIRLKYHWFLSTVNNEIPIINEDKFDDINYFSNEDLLKMDNLSSNMKVFVKKINIKNISS